MSMRVIEGTASLLRDGTRLNIGSETSLQVGDRVAISRGIAELRLTGGTVFEIEDATIDVIGDDALSLRAGQLLADVGSAVHIEADTVGISAKQGAFRVDRALAVRVGVYDGSAKVSGEGRNLSVPRYRQAVVSGGIVPTAPSPLRLSADRWDRRYLQAAIDLDERLTNFGRGLEAQLGALTGIPFFQAVLEPGLNMDHLAPFTDLRRADLLIGLMIALESGGPERINQIMDLWERGGSWGLIALEFGVGQESLFAELLRIVQRAGLIVVGRSSNQTSSGSDPPTPSPSPSRTAGTPSPTPTTPSPSPTAPVPDEVRSPLPDDTEDEIDKVVCGLIGAICSPSP